LAWWHTYKIAVGRIWKAFAKEIWAPLWHYLYPGHTFFVKQGSLSCMVSHMMYVFMARDELQPLLEKVLEEDLGAASRQMAQDLDFLINIAIPVVLLFWGTLKIKH
jgi:hypothetical protein